MRFQVGSNYLFIRLLAQRADNSTFWSTFIPTQSSVKAIEIIPVECFSQLKVPSDCGDPDDKSFYGYVFKDADGDEYYNQYPFAAASQTSDHADRLIQRNNEIGEVDEYYLLPSMITELTTSPAYANNMNTNTIMSSVEAWLKANCLFWRHVPVLPGRGYEHLVKTDIVYDMSVLGTDHKDLTIDEYGWFKLNQADLLDQLDALSYTRSIHGVCSASPERDLGELAALYPAVERQVNDVMAKANEQFRIMHQAYQLKVIDLLRDTTGRLTEIADAARRKTHE